MTSKVFKTAFEIHAKYFGKDAIRNASRDMGKIDRSAKLASKNVKGYFTAIRVGLAGIAGYAGYKALRGIFDIGGKALDAAKDVRKATDQVRQNYGLLVKEGRLSEKELERVTREAFQLAESLKGIDAEDMAVTLSKLSKWLSDDQIKSLAKGYQDYLVTINKGIPTLEQMATAEQKIQSWVKGGRGTILRELGWTQDQIASYKKKQEGLSDVEKESQRAATLTKALGKETGAMARFWQTDAGALYKAEQAQENFNETAGKSGAAVIPELNRSMAELWDALQPVAKMIDKDMSEAVKNLSKWITENKDKIADWGKGIIEWTKWAWDSFWWLQQKSENLFKPIYENSVKEFNNILAGMQAAWDGITKIWDGAAGYFTSIVEAIAKAFIPLYNAIIKPFVDAYNFVAKLFPGSGGGVAVPEASSGGARQEGDYVPEWQGGAAGAGTGGREYAPGIGPVSSANEATGRIPTTSYSKGGRFGPDEMTDRWTEKGYTSTGPNLTRGVVAVNPKIHAIGTVFRDRKTGEAFVAADRHGNVNPKVVDVYENPENYKAAKSAKRDLAVVGKMDKVPKTPEGIREGLKKYSLPQPATGPSMESAMMKLPGGPGSSLNKNIKDINTRQRVEGASGGTNIAMNPTINVTGVAAGSEELVAQKVARVLASNSKENLRQLKRDRSYEIRTGYA